jgi:hypothetical protein
MPITTLAKLSNSQLSKTIVLTINMNLKLANIYTAIDRQISSPKS